MSSPTFPTFEMGPKELFGGSMLCDYPVSFIDVSELRAVPDNQEVFADMHSDQSIIIEILERPTHILSENILLKEKDAPEEEEEESGILTYYFRELAETNDALNNYSIEDMLPINGTHMPQLTDPSPGAENSTGWICLGEQAIYKFKETSPDAQNKVRIYMGLLRLPKINTDILITMNVPMLIGRASSSALRGLMGVEQQVHQQNNNTSSSSGTIVTPSHSSTFNSSSSIEPSVIMNNVGSNAPVSNTGTVDPYATATNTFLRILQSFRIQDWSVFGEE